MSDYFNIYDVQCTMYDFNALKINRKSKIVIRTFVNNFSLNTNTN